MAHILAAPASQPPPPTSEQQLPPRAPFGPAANVCRPGRIRTLPPPPPQHQLRRRARASARRHNTQARGRPQSPHHRRYIPAQKPVGACQPLCSQACTQHGVNALPQPQPQAASAPTATRATHGPGRPAVVGVRLWRRRIIITTVRPHPRRFQTAAAGSSEAQREIWRMDMPRVLWPCSGLLQPPTWVLCSASCVAHGSAASLALQTCHPTTTHAPEWPFACTLDMV